MENNKALFIDVVNRNVTEIEMPKEYGSISKQIGNGCELFALDGVGNRGDGVVLPY